MRSYVSHYGNTSVIVDFGDVEDVVDTENFRSVVAKAVQKEIEDRTRKYLGRYKSRGRFWAWASDKIHHLEELPLKHQDMFNWFLSENSPPVRSGEYHLHAFYDKRASEVYWKLTSRSSVCKVPGRCKQVKVELKYD